MTALRVGSLFAGIGGFDLGLERAGGFETAWFCEQDEFCQHVLAKHWPGVPCYPDICELRGTDVEPVDVLCGGFPCQDLSYAGAGAGLAGARSGLWSEYARLVGELRPRYVIVENVSALLARGMGRVLGDLAALGYDAEWDCIPASAVGAPHQRDRVWIAAYPGGEQHEGAGNAERRPGAAGLPEAAADTAPMQRPSLIGDEPDGDPARGRDVADTYGSGSQGHGAEHGLSADRGSVGAGRGGAGAGTLVADAGGAGRSELPQGEAGGGLAGGGERADSAAGRGREPRGSAGEWWAVEPDVGRVAHGVPARVDRLRSLGNALVPQIAEWIGRRVMDYEAQR